MKVKQSAIGLLLLTGSSFVSARRSPRPLNEFLEEKAAKKDEVLTAAKSSSVKVSSAPLDPVEVGRSADASADPKADPDINLADLIEAINRLEVAKKTEDKVEVQKVAPSVEAYPTKNIYTGQHSLQKQPLHDQKYNNWFEPTTGFRKGNPQLLPQAAAITKRNNQNKKHGLNKEASSSAQIFEPTSSGSQVSFRESAGPTAVYGFTEEGKAQGLEMEEICMNMEAEIEEIVYTDETVCNHVEYDSCHDSFKSVLRKSMVEKCETDYLKECYIDYEIRSKSAKVEVCKESWVRDCDETGDEVCTMEEDAVCEKEFHEITVQDMVTECETVDEEVCFTDPDTQLKKCKSFPKQQCEVVNKDRTEYVPEVKCKKLMTPVCGPESCPLTRSEPVCSDEVKEITVEVPRERCDLIPQKMCSQVPKFIPSLQEERICNKVPKEICHRERNNPVSVKKTVPKKWCGRNTCQLNTKFGDVNSYATVAIAQSAEECADRCFNDRENCDFFFWAGPDGTFGVESTKNECFLGQTPEGQTFKDIQMGSSVQEGAVSGLVGCVTQEQFSVGNDRSVWKASASSVYQNEFEQYGAGQAIDEDTDTQWVSEDQATAQDYFEIDLRVSNPVTSVTVTGRRDDISLASRLNGLQVFVSSLPMPAAATSERDLCGTITSAALADSDFQNEIVCENGPVRGRYLSFQKEAGGPFGIAEVQVSTTL